MSARCCKRPKQWPINFGFLGRGNTSRPRSILDQMKGGCIGLKIHEDWGSMPAVIDTCLSVADELDFQVQLHTDTLNESGFLEDTLAAIRGRTIHMYHTEGAGGGHAPDIIRVAGEINCLPSSTNPTNPYTVNTFDEHLDMTMVCHHLNPAIPEDVAFAESRIRAQTIAAEDVLHDLGAISMLGSDSQGMGRIGEVICRTWQLASKMKDQRGRLPSEKTKRGDNERIKRFIAKYTINAARTFGIDALHRLARARQDRRRGAVAAGLLRHQARDRGQGRLHRLGRHGRQRREPDDLRAVAACARNGAPSAGPSRRSRACFVNPLAIEADIAGKLGLAKTLLPAAGTRKLNKQHMLHNDACPEIKVNPQTFDVYVDGKIATCEPAQRLPLAQRYMLR